MTTILKYEIGDYEIFQQEFFKLVDTTVDLSDYKSNPWITKSDYFGNMNWGDFIIYRIHKFFFRQRIILKIEGEIEEDQVHLRIKVFHFWLFLTNAVFLTIISVILILNVPSIGLISLLIVTTQTLFDFWFFSQKKKEFIKQFEEILKRAA